MKIVLLLAAVGVVFGFVSGWVGVTVEHYNESLHRGQYGKYEWDFVVTGALPGMLWVNSQLEYDWRIDEAWIFREEIIKANSVIWGAVFAAFCTSFKLVSWWCRKTNQVSDGDLQ
jgi:hypothetical protein